MNISQTIVVIYTAALLVGCSGTTSTFDEGIAYKMTRFEAVGVAENTIAEYITNDYVLPTKGLTTSGYDRALIDTHTYSVTAVPFGTQDTYGFKVRHSGTLFRGPWKASDIYESVKDRANRVGEAVQIKNK